MRALLLILPLLAACGWRENPQAIQKRLRKTPIPVGDLMEAFYIKPGEIRVLGGTAPPVFDPHASSPWILENASRRSLWIHREELELTAWVTPLLSYPGRCGGTRPHSPPLPRPTFDPVEWLLLEAGQTVPFRLSTSFQTWGRLELRAYTGNRGRHLADTAASFNAGQWTLTPHAYVPTFVLATEESWVLPPFDWSGPGKVDGYEMPPLRVSTTSSASEFVWVEDLPFREEPGDPAPLKIFVLTESRTLVYQGALDPLSQRVEPSTRGRSTSTTRYRLKAPLPPGRYRAFFAGTGPWLYDRENKIRRAGFSLWIPLEIPR